MERKFLEGLELEGGVKLSKEIIDKIMDENGKDINKAKGDLEDVQGELKKAKETIKERDKQLEGLKDVDVEKLNDTIETLKEENKEAAKKHEQELKDIKLTNAIKLAIAGKVFDEDMAASLFDKSKLVLTDDGKVAGLNEQLESIKKDKSFLFKTDKVDTHYDPNGGGAPTGTNPFAKDTFNLTEQGKLLKENPAQAKELAAAAGVTLNI